MNSEAQLAALDRALGDRELIWFGIRGDDAAAMLRLPQFTSCFSVTAPLRAAKLAVSESLEDITGLRVDLDTYDIDIDPGAEVLLLRRRLLARANRRSAIATYRPSHFLSAAHFASLDTAQYLGLFKDRQTAFEHKPWVETQLRRIGVRTLDWRYFADESRHEVRRSLERGPLVLRASRSSGGEGIELLESPDALDEKWPFRNDHLVAVSRYLADSVPVNIGACVFPGGTVVLHPASVQLIGIPECTNRRFGYCGNDFGAFAELDPSIVQDVDRTTRLVGAWLASVGYLGAFGVDYLVTGSEAIFTEINARMQGSTALSAELAQRIGHPGILGDHLAAFLGVEPGDGLSAEDWVKEVPRFAQIIVHNVGSGGVERRSSSGGGSTPSPVRLELLPDAGVVVEPGAVLFREVHDGTVTRSGYDLSAVARQRIAAAKQSFNDSGMGSGMDGG